MCNNVFWFSNFQYMETGRNGHAGRLAQNPAVEAAEIEKGFAPIHHHGMAVMTVKAIGQALRYATQGSVLVTYLTPKCIKYIPTNHRTLSVCQAL